MKKIIPLAVCAAVAAPFLGFSGFVSAYSDIDKITVNPGNGGMDECNIYYDYKDQSNPCNSSFGSYEKRVLTLKSGMNDTKIKTVRIALSDKGTPFKITADSDIKANIEFYSVEDNVAFCNFVFDFGSHSFTGEVKNMEKCDITIQSGTYNINSLKAKSLTINGGAVNSGNISEETNVTINGGSLNGSTTGGSSTAGGSSTTGGSSSTTGGTSSTSGTSSSTTGGTSTTEDKTTAKPIADSPKTPDTGAANGESSSAILIAVSLGLITMTAGAGYLATYALRRQIKRVRFDR